MRVRVGRCRNEGENIYEGDVGVRVRRCRNEGERGAINRVLYLIGHRGYV